MIFDTHGKSNSKERLYALQIVPPKILTMNTDGSDCHALINNTGGHPDGITADLMRGHLYWTNMGKKFNQEDGFIERSDLDGCNRVIIVPRGATFTPKQIEYDPVTDRLYWCDREGMRVMSCDRDGKDIRTLVQTGEGAEDRKNKELHCVGIAVDPQNGYFYWTQKGPSKGNAGRILRAGLNPPDNYDPSHRSDITVLLDNLPEPIDLLLSPDKSKLYWTDRGQPPKGNTLNVADIVNGQLINHRILINSLKEGIGVCPNQDWTKLYVSDLVLGHIRRYDVEKSETGIIHRGWPITGMVCVPASE